MPYCNDIKTDTSFRLCLAPMMNRTDRFFRYIVRRLSGNVRLYTEMVSTAALLHGSAAKQLQFDPSEHPIAVQLGGHDPAEFADCARIAAATGFDEINLNIGCPSTRVQRGRIGACLMDDPALVAECVAAITRATNLPVTVKTRIGIEEHYDYVKLTGFIGSVAAAGCKTIMLHARKAWLAGLNPKENRDIPPLDYETVYRVKRDYPDLRIVINGGIRTVKDVDHHLAHCDGVMIGREFYQNPYQIVEFDRRLFGAGATPPTRKQLIESLYPFIRTQLEAGLPIGQILRHLLNMYHGQPGARKWRRILTDCTTRPDAGLEVIRLALAEVTEHQPEIITGRPAMPSPPPRRKYDQASRSSIARLS